MNTELINKFIESIIKKTLAHTLKWTNLDNYSSEGNKGQLLDDVVTYIFFHANENNKRNFICDTASSFIAESTQGHILIINEFDKLKSGERIDYYHLYIGSKDNSKAQKIITSEENTILFRLINAINNVYVRLENDSFVESFIDDFLKEQ